MKTYFINSIKQVSINSHSLDITSTLKTHEWIVFNEDTSFIEKFLFVDDDKLLVSVNGKSSYSKWKYVKVNSSLIIDDDKNKYLLKIVVCNKDIIVLNVDSTNEYSFLINSKSSVLQNASYPDIQWYLIRNCGVDILNEEQRRQLVEEKNLENEKNREELQEKKQELQEIKKACIVVPIIGLFMFIVASSIKSCSENKKSYNEYKEKHTTIYVTEEKNKVAVELGLNVKWASRNVEANSPEEMENTMVREILQDKSMLLV